MNEWLRNFARPYARDGVLATLGALFGAALALVPPLLSQELVNEVLLRRDLGWLWPILGASLAFALLREVAGYAQGYLSERMGQGVLQQLRESLYGHLTGLSYTYYDSVQTGQLISRLISDVEWVRMFFSNFFTQGAQVAFTLLFVIVAIFVEDAPLGFILLALLPFLTWFVLAFDRRIRPAFRGIRAQFAIMTTQLQESISGVRVVKAFAQEPREMSQFDTTLGGLFDRNIDAARLWTSFFPLFDLIGGFYGLVVFLFGGWQVIHHEITVGALVAISGYVILLINPLRNLGQVLNMVAQAAAAGARLFELMNERPAIEAPAQPYRPTRADGRIEFRNVSLTYPGSETAALTGISFRVDPGRSLALVGPTGAGKTSIVSLIPRLYDVTGGAVLVDGVDVRDWDPVVLRRQVGVVMQETFLFSATVADNILFGRPDASHADVVRAAELAQAAEFIESLPQGYDTIVGERGLGLSGGQRQRLAIARAILVDPPIVILDDATASVDLETEALIQQGMKNLLAGRTAIVVAHRLSSLQAADEILVVDGGRIVQRGRHLELAQEPGIYREVHAVQYRDREQVRAFGAS
jgi:ATP-binding cassette subfamily B multidrug efflux pump